ncbi:MAG: pantoate--beta-alanine ligase [Flavobacteriaceae bacterium]|nr:pantoate--beta-alanine ligase [Flavobacteriaceae bacterium]|tara:strand:- start:19083 stop:19931 length:849 start_codon:yes stop_codon:yes gene_type:complete
MILFRKKSDLAIRRGDLKKNNFKIGLVPTMGALHAGHLSLVKRSIKENDYTIVSIFINPTQFNDKKDLISYPKNLTKDCQYLDSVSRDIIVFAPEISEIYDKNLSVKKFNFQGLDKFMEGKYRRGHFNGVATVVSHLLDIIKPNNAYFGEKDYQQLRIIQQLVIDNNISANIIGCDTIREEDGLALSSRNSKITEPYRKFACKIFEAINYARINFNSMNFDDIYNYVNNFFDNIDDIELEYFTIAESEFLIPVNKKTIDKKYRAFIAVKLQGVRLIDNIALN